MRPLGLWPALAMARSIGLELDSVVTRGCRRILWRTTRQFLVYQKKPGEGGGEGRKAQNAAKEEEEEERRSGAERTHLR